MLPPVPGSCAVTADWRACPLTELAVSSMTYGVTAGNWDFTRKAFPILSPEPFSAAVKFPLLTRWVEQNAGWTLGSEPPIGHI